MLGIREPGQLAAHPLRGGLFKNWVITELLKEPAARGEESRVYFWRDKEGHEVDAVVGHKESQALAIGTAARGRLRARRGRPAQQPPEVEIDSQFDLGTGVLAVGACAAPNGHPEQAFALGAKRVLRRQHPDESRPEGDNIAARSPALYRGVRAFQGVRDRTADQSSPPETLPKKEVAKRLHGDDKTRLAFGLSGALAEPGGDCRVSGVVKFAEQNAVELEGVADQPEDGEHEVPVGHRGADLVGDEGALDEGAALVARSAEAALFVGKQAEEFMAAVGAVQAGEASLKVAAVEEGGDGRGGLGGKAGDVGGVIVENLPDRRGAGLAGAVADADHLRGRSRWA